MAYYKKNKKLYYVIKYWAHIRRASKNGFYMEALQVPHSYINGQMQMLLQLEGQRTRPDDVYSSDYNRKIDTSDELGYSQLAKVLYVAGVINYDLYKRLIQFNSMRNKIIHKLFVEYAERDNGIPIADVKKAIENGIKLCDEVRERGEMIIDE